MSLGFKVERVTSVSVEGGKYWCAYTIYSKFTVSVCISSAFIFEIAKKKCVVQCRGILVCIEHIFKI